MAHAQNKLTVSAVVEKYELPIDIIVLGRHQRMESFRDN